MDEIINFFSTTIQSITDFLSSTLLSLKTASISVLEIFISFFQEITNVLNNLLDWMGI